MNVPTKTRGTGVTKVPFLRRYKRLSYFTLVFLFPLLIPSVLVVELSPAETEQHSNRQLLEHGLRGSTTGDDLVLSTTIGKGIGSNHSNIQASNVTIPLHAHSGSHHVHLYVGSPPQRQTLIVDTGSKAMAFPCKTCKTCSNSCCGQHASPYFDPSLSTTHRIPSCGECLLEGISKCSSTLRWIPPSSHHRNTQGDFCTFSQKYTEGSSWTATEVEDMIWMGSSDVLESLETFLPLLAIAHPFGCQTKSQGLFREQYADGILGLSIHETSLIAGLHREGLIDRNAFGLCLTHKAGVLSLGGSLSQKYHKAPMITTPVVQSPLHSVSTGYYTVEVVSLSMGSRDASYSQVITNETTRSKFLEGINDGKGCILDSGTTDTYFPSSLARIVRSMARTYALDHASNHKRGQNDAYYDVFSPHEYGRSHPRKYTYTEFREFFPHFTIVFANNATMVLSPNHYMEGVPLDSVTGEVIPWKDSLALTNRLYFTESDGGAVLGANAFVGYDLVFDATQGSSQVGIAQADCYGATLQTGNATPVE